MQQNWRCFTRCAVQRATRGLREITWPLSTIIYVDPSMTTSTLLYVDKSVYVRLTNNRDGNIEVQQVKNPGSTGEIAAQAHS